MQAARRRPSRPVRARLAAAAPEVDRHQLRDARLLHRHAVQPVGDLHRAPVVGDDDELRAVGHLAHQLVEAADVGLVERRVDLVEDAERRRLDQEDREQQRDRGERLLAARQQLDVLAAFLPGGWAMISMPVSSRSLLVGRARGSAVPAAEQAREDLLELGVDRVEGLAEALARGRVDLLDRRLELSDRRLEVGSLRGQEVEALLQLLATPRSRSG